MVITAITYNDGELSHKKALVNVVKLTPAKAKTGAAKIINNILFIRDDQPSFLSKQFTEFN